MSENLPVNIDDIEAAAARIRGHAVRTPLLSSQLIDARVGARILFKPECLQRTGSFKFRGAYNAVAMLPDGVDGVVAFSSGNHGQGVAAAATAQGLSAKIVMPADAPAIKLRNTGAYGGEVITYDRRKEDRHAIGAKIAEEENRALIPPYDYAPVIAGQGTTGLEIAEDLEALGLVPDRVICPCGGGGLIAGTSLVMRECFPRAEVWAAEPEHYDDTKRSLETDNRQEADVSTKSICDALMAPTPGELTFAVNRHTLSGGVAVTDAEVRDAMRVAFSDLKVVVEPGGAVAMAAVLSGALPVETGETVVVVLSGGNVDPAFFADVLSA
ncbi:MAG: threonine/serine dehydratase [Rhodospirillales bacterium]